MNLSEPGSPSGARPAQQQQAKQFFSHSMEPLPAVDPPYFVALFDQHVASVNLKETSLTMADYVDVCRSAYQEHLKRPANHFTQNDAIQSLLDMPLSHFGVSEGWERRKNLVRAFTTSFFQRGVTVCAAHIRHALVQSAAGFERRGHEGGTYVASDEGLVLHSWRSQSEVRRFVAVMRKLWQLIFELQLRTIRCPVVSVYMYRGILFTVTAMIPLVPAADGAPELTRGALLLHELDVLRHALGVAGVAPTTDFGVQRGGDGRYYVLDVDACLPLKMELPMIDAGRFVRFEAYAHLPPTFLAPTASSPPAAAILRSTVMTTLVPKAVQAVLEVVRARECNLAACVKDQVCSRALHSVGLSLRFFFAVYEEIFDQESNPTLGFDAKELNCALESIELELVCRAVKEMMRCELRSSPGEDDVAHCQRVNRLMASLVNKKSGVWQEQMMPLLRRKFGAPDNFNINLTSGTVKVLASYVSSRLGVAFDKASFRFNGFVGVPIATCIFAPPDELLMTVAAQPAPGLTATASSANLKNELSTSTEARTSPTNAAAPTPLTRRDTMAVLQAPSADDAEIAKQTIATSFQALWETLMSEERAFALANKATYGSATNTELLVRFYRILTLERMMQLPGFEKHRSELLSFKYSAYPLHEVADEARKHPPVPPDRLAQAAVQVKVMGLADKLKAVEREKFDILLEILTNNGENFEDAIAIGRYLVHLAKQFPGEAATYIRAARHMRHATWLDIGLVNDFFAANITAAAAMNITSNTSELKEALKNVVRVTARLNAKTRRPQAVSALRKVSAALVASQDVAACEALKTLCKDSYDIHCDRFGTADPQSGVAHAHCVFVYATANREKLSASHDKELKKFHYYVSTMGTSTIDALKQLLASEAYNNNVSSVIMALQSAGETTMAEKAMTHVMASGGPSTTMVTRTVDVLQAGAGGKLTNLLRMFVTNDKSRQLKKLTVMDHAYRVGVDYEEMVAWQRVKRAEVESLHRTARKTTARIEKEEREKLVDLIWRARYEARREERVREKEEEALRQKDAKRREAQEAADRLAAKTMPVPAAAAAPAASSVDNEDARMAEEQRRREKARATEELLAREKARREEEERASEERRVAAELAVREKAELMARARKVAEELEELHAAQRAQFFDEESRFRRAIETEEADVKADLAAREFAKRQRLLRQLHERLMLVQEERALAADIAAAYERETEALRASFAVQHTEIVERERLMRQEALAFQRFVATFRSEEVTALVGEESARRDEIVVEEETTKRAKVRTFEEEREGILRRLHQRIALDLEEQRARARIVNDRNFEIAFLFDANEIQVDEILTRAKFYELQFELWKLLMKQFRDETARLQRAIRQLALDEARRRREIEEEERAARAKLFMWFIQERLRIETEDILRRKHREMKEAHRLAMLREQEKRRALLEAKRKVVADTNEERSANELLIAVQRAADLKAKSLMHDGVFVSERQLADAKAAESEAKRAEARDERARIDAEVTAVREARERELAERRAVNAAAAAARRAEREAAQRLEREEQAKRLAEIEAELAKVADITSGKLPRTSLLLAATDSQSRSGDNLAADAAARLDARRQQREQAAKRKATQLEEARFAAGRKRDLLAACLFLMQRDTEVSQDQERERREAEEREAERVAAERANATMAERREFATEHRRVLSLLKEKRTQQLTTQRSKLETRRDAGVSQRETLQSKRLLEARVHAQQHTFEMAVRKLEAAKKEAREWDVQQAVRAETRAIRRIEQSSAMRFMEVQRHDGTEKQVVRDSDVLGRIHDGVDLVDVLQHNITQLHDANPEHSPSSPSRRTPRATTANVPSARQSLTQKDREPPTLPPLVTIPGSR